MSAVNEFRELVSASYASPFYQRVLTDRYRELYIEGVDRAFPGTLHFSNSDSAMLLFGLLGSYEKGPGLFEKKIAQDVERREYANLLAIYIALYKSEYIKEHDLNNFEHATTEELEQALEVMFDTTTLNADYETSEDDEEEEQPHETSYEETARQAQFFAARKRLLL